MDEKEKERLTSFKISLWIMTTCFGFVATGLFFGILACSQYYIPKLLVHYTENHECVETKHSNEIKMEVVPHLKTTHEGIYSIVELEFFNKSLEYNNEHVAYYKRKHLKYLKPRDIPILLIPQFGDPPNFHVPLAKMVHSRTKDRDFRFRWYTVTFNGSIPETYLTRMDYYGAAIKDASAHIRNTNSSQESILIGRGFAGFRAFSSAIHDHMENVTNAADLVILLSTALRSHGYYDREMGLLMKQDSEQWIENASKYPIGVVSFEPGFNETNVLPSSSRLPHVGQIPVWTMDGVPDIGLSGSAMSKCEPLLNVIADLIVSYGEKHQRRGGRAIAKSFIDEWESKKGGPLPPNWKQDQHENSLKVEIGETYIFVINSSRWIDIDVQRNGSLILEVTGICLTSATIIRRQKFIQRKEHLLEYAFFEFGIYQVMPFEDVKLFLESSEKCRVTIKTSPWWTGYSQKFHDGLTTDLHYFWVGAQLTLTLLVSLESDKELHRIEHQLYVYIVFILAVFYHTFHTFGVPFPGMICGAGFSIALHYLSVCVHDSVLLDLFPESFDSMYSRFMQDDFFRVAAAVVPLLLNIGATKLAAQIAIFIYSVDVRVFLIKPMVFTLMHHSFFETEPIIYGVAYRYSFTGFAIFIGVILRFPTLHTVLMEKYSFLNNFVNTYLPRQFTRSHFHCWGYLALALDFALASNSLDWHYAVTILILVFNRLCDTYCPRGLQDYPISPWAMQTKIIKTENI